jgi:hypothetical protein
MLLFVRFLRLLIIHQIFQHSNGGFDTKFIFDLLSDLFYGANGRRIIFISLSESRAPPLKEDCFMLFFFQERADKAWIGT